MSGRWSLLTNHAFVLAHVVEHPRSTLRQIADAVGITDRAALSILRGLEEDAIITRTKQGRRNRYAVDIEALMQHRSQGKYTIGELVAALRLLAQRVPEVGITQDLRIARPSVNGQQPAPVDGAGPALPVDGAAFPSSAATSDEVRS